MRITFVLPYASLAGGIRVVAIYSDRLQKRGHKVTIVSLPRPAMSFKQKIKFLLKEKKWPDQKRSPSHLDGLNIEHRLLEKYRPICNDDVPDADVVIATWWETAEWVNSFKPAKGKKIYFVQHHEIFQGQPIERVKATYLLPLRKITISNWLVQIMKNEYGDEDVALVPNAVDYDFFNSAERKKQATPTIGFLYFNTHSKGCDIVIEALVQARKHFPTLQILTFGSGPLSKKLPLPENSKYYFQPAQDKIREIYSSCDFWLFGSREEGFGLPILEAMACRTPVIATKAGAAPELLAGGAGILIEDWSVERMTEGVLNACTMTPEEWRRRSQLARDTATRYSWDDAILLFEKALEGC
jgi:glycosyltransferase involved in cell wall biosynthesis